MSCFLPFLEFWMSIDLSVNISLRTFLDFFSEGCMENDKNVIPVSGQQNNV